MKLDDFKSVGAAITLSLIVLFALVFAFLCFGEVNAANKDFFNIFAMALVGWLGIGVGYYLGSSNSSAKKSETIESLSNKETP